LAVYSGVKSFDLCFGEGLWAELRGHGVDVLSLVLGQTDTPEYRRVLKQAGLPVPPNLASPDAVAELGLTRLPHGPICNWGSSDEENGFAPASPAQRRARILAIEQASKAYTQRG
jgi:short-subunit dehydrogenase